MRIRIALAGNPNSGKTTLFNALTGSKQSVGNWPGVTVEKKEGLLKGWKEVLVQDLPGIYSLSPYTPEEVVTRRYLVEEKPEVILNIVDGTNIERNLYLTTQLLELGLPVVVAVNMMDVLEKNGVHLRLEVLAEKLGCPVVGISALKNGGILEATELAIRLAQTRQAPQAPPILHGTLATVAEQIEVLLGDFVAPALRHWYSLKLLERDEGVMQELSLPQELQRQIEDVVTVCEVQEEDDGASLLAAARYDYVTALVAVCMEKRPALGVATASDRVDAVVTSRWLALPIFVTVMGLVYYLAMGPLGGLLTDWTNDILFGEWIMGRVSTSLEASACAPWLVSLLVDGVIGGVGAVMGFVPQILLLFFMLSILEDVGYMARVAFIMDKLFRKFGMSGKSFIPMLVATGCAVPGIMATRTIENQRERRMTIMTTAFMPCGAKMPILAMFAGALFDGSWLVAVSAYCIGVTAVILSGLLLKQLPAFRGELSPFVMELPRYHAPSPHTVLRITWERGWGFIVRAGTVIFVSSVILWFLQGFGLVEGSLRMVEDNNTSLLATVGGVLAPVFAPLGFGQWQSVVAVITGLIAKENVVGTFGVLYGVAEVAEDGAEVWAMLAADFSRLSAYSFMIFNLLCAPCFGAIGAIRREMNDARWTWAAVGYMTAFAYGVSLVLYQLGSLLLGGSFGWETAMALLVLVGFVCVLVRSSRTEKERKG